MLEYRAEGLCRNANHLSKEELNRCIATGEILQSTALAYDTEHRLRFELCGQRAYMPHDECLDVAAGEEIKDIAVLTRVGRPTCFVITGTSVDENGEECYLLSRAAANAFAGANTWIRWKPAVLFPVPSHTSKISEPSATLAAESQRCFPSTVYRFHGFPLPVIGFRLASSCCAPSKTGMYRAASC